MGSNPNEEQPNTNAATDNEAAFVVATNNTPVKQLKQIRSNRSRLERGTRVSGPHGNLIPNPKGHGRRIRERTRGCIAESPDNDACLVCFECGVEKECISNTIHRENATIAITLNEMSAQEREQRVADGEDIAANPNPNVDTNEESDEDEAMSVGDMSASIDVNPATSIAPFRHKIKLHAARDSIKKTQGETVEVTRGRGAKLEKIACAVIKKHVPMDLEEETKKKRDKREKTVEHREIEKLQVEEEFIDPSVASGSSIS